MEMSTPQQLEIKGTHKNKKFLKIWSERPFHSTADSQLFVLNSEHCYQPNICSVLKVK